MSLSGVLFLVLATLLAGQRQASSQSAPLHTPAPTKTAPSSGFTLVDATVQLEAGALNGEDTLLLKADQLSADDMKAALTPVEDIGVAAPSVRFDPNGVKEVSSASGPSTRQWLLRARVEGMSPRGSTQTRYVTFSLGERRETYPYTLTNASAASFAWTIRGPLTEVSLQPGGAVDLGVAVGPVAATGVTLLQAQLAETTTKEPLPAPGLVLCPTAGECDGNPFALAANSANRLWLRAQDNLPSGRYAGTITVGASEKPSGETFNLTVNATTSIHIAAGLVAVASGVLLSFLACIFLPNRTNRDQALLPAVKLRDQLEPLSLKLQQPPKGYGTDDPVPATRRKIAALKASLSVENLDKHRFLPRTWTGPLGGDPASKVEEYKAFLQNVETSIAALGIIVHDGVAQAWKKWDLQRQDVQNAVKVAVRSMDLPANAEDLTPAMARDGMKAELGRLDAAIAGLPNSQPQISGALGDARTPSYERVDASITRTNVLLWVIVAALATLTGFYTLVWSNPGFGLLGDYVKCVLWGFGLPTAGQQLLALTPTSLRTTLTASVPKL